MHPYNPPFLSCLSFALALAGPAGLCFGDPGPPAPITVETAVRLAIEQDPVLRQIATQAEVADALVDQAGRRPNPTVSAEFDNMLGDGVRRGTRAMEVTIGLSQTLETAGKRDHRTTLARRERDKVDWDHRVRRAEIAATARAAHVAALIAQERVELRRQQAGLARESLAETRRMVEAARLSLLDQARAELEARQREHALRQAEAAAAAARSRLAALWGESPARPFTVAGSLNEVSVPNCEVSVPNLEDLLAQIDGTAAVGRFEADAAALAAMLRLERAQARPDLEIFGGVRAFSEADGDVAFLAGISVPWPLFDRNRGAIRAARARVDAVTHAREAARRQLARELAAAHAELTAAATDAATLRDQLVPLAVAALELAEAGLERGQLAPLTVLDSRRTLFDLRDELLDALARQAEAAAAIQSLTQSTANAQ